MTVTKINKMLLRKHFPSFNMNNVVKIEILLKIGKGVQDGKA